MSEYAFRYPSSVLLSDNFTQVHITMQDNKYRVLIPETRESLGTLTHAFRNERFSETILEVKKPGQIGNGFRKKISQYFDIHIRFIRLHKGKIAIDGEVETSTGWIEHVTTDNWYSIVYETMHILRRYNIQCSLWHKRNRSYVRSIIKNRNIYLPAVGNIKTKDVVITTAVIVGIIITAYYAYKYHKTHS